MVTRTKKVFVGGLSAPTTIDDVKNYFQQFGRVSFFFDFHFVLITYRSHYRPNNDHQQIIIVVRGSKFEFKFRTSTTTTTGTTTINGQLRLINNKTDDDDYDLNIVFDEIGALQHKGLNEPEDDNSTAPLQLLSPSQQQSSYVDQYDQR